MPVKNNMFVSTPKKPDISEVGESPSKISNEEWNRLTDEEKIAINKETLANINAEYDARCTPALAGTTDEKVVEHKANVVANQNARLTAIAQIPQFSIECNKISKLSNFLAKAEAAIMGPVELAQEVYEDLLDGLQFIQDQVNELANFCDNLDTSTNLLSVQADAGFLGILDVAIGLADPTLWQKLAECGTKLALLPASILSQATREIAGKSVESLAIIVNTVETTKLSDLEDAIKASASIVGDSAEDLVSFESILALAGLTKDQLIQTLPFGFNPGEDLLYARDIWNATRDKKTNVYESVVSPTRQLMARAMVERLVNPRLNSLPESGVKRNPSSKFTRSNSNGVSNVYSSGDVRVRERSIVFGDTFQDQTGYIHILNENISTEDRIEIYRNNKKVRSRKLNPVPEPVKVY